MMEGMGQLGQPGQRLLTANEKVRRVWVKTKTTFFCSGYYVSTIFRNLQRMLKSEQGAWHCSNMLPTMTHCQAFCIITSPSLSPNRKVPTMIHCQAFCIITSPSLSPNREGSPYPPPGDVVISSVGLSPGNFHRYPVLSDYKHH